MALIDGTADADILDGGGEDDVISGLAGNDTLRGHTGADQLFGGADHDLLESASGADLMSGGTGNDTLINEGGDDTAYGGTGNDRLIMGDLLFGSGGRAFGGAGDDDIYFSECTASTANGGDGLDMLRLTWTEPLETGDVLLDFSTATGTITSTLGLSLAFAEVERFNATLGTGNDTVRGGAFDDAVNLLAGQDLVDMAGGQDTVSYTLGSTVTLEGGAGNDLLIVTEYQATSVYFIIDDATGTVDDGQLSQITGFETYDLRGSSVNDIISLAAGNDSIYSGRGDDTLFGKAGDDLFVSSHGADELFGGDGNDRLNGGGGSDLIEGGAGSDRISGAGGTDTLTGGAGADHFQFGLGSNPGFDLITDFTSGEDVIHYLSAQIGVLSPGPGRLAANELRNDAPLGTHGQFVTLYREAADETWLVWYDKGTLTNGAVAYLRFQGDVTLAASDLILF